jgi:hypothetical protein
MLCGCVVGISNNIEELIRELCQAGQLFLCPFRICLAPPVGLFVKGTFSVMCVAFRAFRWSGALFGAQKKNLVRHKGLITGAYHEDVGGAREAKRGGAQ